MPKRSPLLDLDCSLLELLEANQPCTLKCLFYAAGKAGLLPLNNKSYDLMQRRLGDLRKSGRIPASWLPDPTQSAGLSNHPLNAPEAITNLASQFRINRQQCSSVRLEIWTERKSYYPVIRETAHQFSVDMFDAGPKPSNVFMNTAAGIANLDGRPLKLILLTDFNGNIPDSQATIEAGMKKRLGSQFAGTVKLAVTPEQIKQFALEPVPKLRRGSSKSTSFSHGQWYEVESIPPRITRSLLETAIVSSLKNPADFESRWAEAMDTALRELKRFEQELRSQPDPLIERGGLPWQKVQLVPKSKLAESQTYHNRRKHPCPHEMSQIPSLSRFRNTRIK